jgi:hypothetical protein
MVYSVGCHYINSAKEQKSQAATCGAWQAL